MKLSWKIFFSSLIITILTFSIGGYFLISAVFQSSFNRENLSALEENKMLCSYFAALISESSSEEQNKISIVNISESIISNLVNDKLTIRISDKEQNVIALSGNLNFDTELVKNLEVYSIAYKTIEDNGNYYIQTASSIQISGGKIYLETVHDISSVFLDRQNLFSFYKKLIFLVLIFNGSLVFFMTLWTMHPLKRLSNTTRKIAEGNYSDRAIIQTKDEIGLLARDFNKMADSLEAKIHDLEATTISQRDFIGSFAHEIKTPLTSIIGYADMLRSKKMNEENRILASDYIFKEGKRLETLSLKLLNLIVVKNHNFDMKQINMKDLFKNIEDIMKPIFTGTCVTLETFSEDTVIRVEVDLIKILIINLIDNARKSILKSGVIKLSGKRISNERFMIIVQDNGKGIPAEELSRITEIFYTVDKSRSRDKGAGIGLFLCKEIVDLHGGEMKFESQLGVGTNVYLDLIG